MIKNNKFINTQYNIFFLSKAVAICLLILTFNNQSSYATEAKFDGLGRVRSCEKDSNGEIVVEPINSIGFNGGKDIEFSANNQVCRAIAIASYADVKLSIAAMNGGCGSGSPIPRVFPSVIQDVRDLAKAGKTALTNSTCSVLFINGMRSYTTALVSFAVVNSIAKNKFNSVKICGSGWHKPNPEEYVINTPGIKKDVTKAINDSINSFTPLTINDINYRQFIYDGVEVEDNTNQGEICYDATYDKVNGQYPRQKYYLRGSQIGRYNCQKYLVSTGQDKLGAKLSPEKIADLKNSYECCVKRSKNFICLQDGDSKLFCKAGSTCNINGIFYRVWFENNERLICSQSYSLCPYNFNIEGGSDYCDTYCDGISEENSCHPPKKIDNSRYLNAQEWNDQIKKGECGKDGTKFTATGTPVSEVRNSDCTLNEFANKCRNYCQYMRHCTVASDTKFTPVNSITSPYFSQACLDFVGDSKNVATFDGGMLGSYTNFSAPIAQCFKETMENLFFNRVGHSRCINSAELPNKLGECSTNGVNSDASYLPGYGFIYKTGSNVQSNSVFGAIQEKMQVAIKIFLSIAVMFFGVNILIQKINLGDKKTLMLFLLKFAIVVFFSLGNAWQGFFFNAVYDLGGDLGNILYNIKTPFGSTSPEKLDGCQFGVIRSKSGEVINNSNVEGVNKQEYPAGKKYLAIWDTMDCKIAKYLGIGIKVSAANIVVLIIASVFTGPIGIYFACSILFFGLLVVFITFRALHIFICSCISIVIFVFISPIIFPTLLFEKTKNIFDSWFKEIIGFGLQMAILFAYIGIVFSVMDEVMVGQAKFVGDNPKSLSCNQFCVKATGATETDITKCTDSNDLIFDPLDTSVLCLINLDPNGFSAYPGLEVIGISMVALKSLFGDTSKTTRRLLMIFKAVLVLFLLYKFMDDIPEVAEQLIGGTKLPGSNAGAIKVLTLITAISKGFAKRARRGSIKIAKAADEKANQKKEDEDGKK